MSYKPRSGSFRKVIYPLKIHHEEDIPLKDLRDVVKMIDKIKAEEDGNQHLNNMQTVKNGVVVTPRKASVPGSVDTNKCKCNQLPTPSFSLAPVDLYRRVYQDDDSLPPFPVTSIPDHPFGSDSDVTDIESDYDMDSEDEEWLNKNKSLQIAPSRLEFIFTKLNQRDTHVPEKAIGALPEPFHSDFHRVFPYWKEKRLQHKNNSSFRSNLPPNLLKGEVKLAAGYMSTDPSVAFTGKVRKSMTQQSQPPLKVQRKAEAIASYNKMVSLEEALGKYHSKLQEIMQKGLKDRDQIKNKLIDFTRRCENYKIGESENKDPNNNKVMVIRRKSERKPKERACVKPPPISSRVTRQSRVQNMGSRNVLQDQASKLQLGSLTAVPSKSTQAIVLRLDDEKLKPINHRKSRKTSMFEHIPNENNWNKNDFSSNTGGKKNEKNMAVLAKLRRRVPKLNF